MPRLKIEYGLLKKLISTLREHQSTGVATVTLYAIATFTKLPIHKQHHLYLRTV